MYHAGSIFRKVYRTDQKYLFPDCPWICSRDKDEFSGRIPYGLDEKSNRAIHSIMGTFNLTWKEALEEFIIYTYKSGDVEAGAIWL